MTSETDVVPSATPITPVVGDQPAHPPNRDAPQKRTGGSAAIRAEILSYIIAETQAAALPKGWGFLGASPGMRQLAGDRCELAALLQQQFSAEDLVTARVLVRGKNPQLQLARVFGDITSKFLVTCDAGKNPIDVISARGMLSSCDPPCLQYGLARYSTGAQGKWARMILAATDDDLHVYHRLGYWCTPAAQLDRLTGKHARQLFARNISDYHLRKYHLTLPGWQIANVVNEPSPLAQQIFRQLWKMEHVYGFDSSELFDVWCPNQAHFSSLQSALAFVDPDITRELLNQSLHKSMTTPADSWYKVLDTTDVDLPSARAELLRAIGRSREALRPAEVRVATARFQRSFHQSVIAKFYQDISNLADPSEQMLLLVSSELAQHWFDSQEILAAAQLAVAGRFPGDPGVINDASLDQRLRVADVLLKIRRERLRQK